MRRTLESIIHQPPSTAAAVKIKFLAEKYYVEAIIQQPGMCRDMGSTNIGYVLTVEEDNKVEVEKYRQMMVLFVETQ